MDLRAASEEAAFGGVDSPLTDMRTERLERGGERERRAKVALARKLATVLHRLWVEGSEFRFGRETAAA